MAPWRDQSLPGKRSELIELSGNPGELPPDAHLDDYGETTGFDYNEIEMGRFDDDPDPYSGTYSEE